MNMKTTIALLLFAALSCSAQTTLNAPTPQYDPSVVHNSPSYDQPVDRGHRLAWGLTYGGITAGYIAADYFDVTRSERAFKQGYVEGNTFLVCGESAICRPSAGALVERDAVEYIIASAPALVARAFRHKSANVNALSWGFLTGPAVAVVKHIQGAEAGK